MNISIQFIGRLIIIENDVIGSYEFEGTIYSPRTALWNSLL